MSESDISVSLTRAYFSEQLRERGFARATAEDLKGHISAVESKLMGFDLFGPDPETLLDGDKKLRKLLKKHRAREHARLSMRLSEGNEWLAGELSAGESPRPIVVHLPEAFPFAPPEVFPRSGFPRSWHRNRDGSMCLYPSEDRGGLPWLDPDSFLELIERWFSESAAGWPGDFPLLDIEAYIPRSSTEHRLLLYGDLDGLTWVKFQVADFVITLDGAGQRSPGSPKWTKGTLRYGYVADIGTLFEPPQDWGDLATLMGEVAEPVRKAILALEVSILLVRYQRDGLTGVLALHVSPDADGTGVDLSTLTSASQATRDLTLRAGVHSSRLGDKRVIVIGAGAVGSHVADSLARAGVGFLALADHDRIRPGNLVRHIATHQHVGWPKVAAVRDVIVSRHFNVTEVDAIAGGLVNLDAAQDVVNGYDLVIDATANGSVTAMLHHAAKAAGAHVLSVCLKENGQVARVDILPPLAGDPMPQPSPSPASETPLAYESGCFSAVSLTPHAAVIEAASLAARHALALLTAQPINAAGTERDYR